MVNDQVHLGPLMWDDKLAKAASDYLSSISGSAVIPSQYFNDKKSNHFADMYLTYEAHQRAVLLPHRFMWSDALEVIFDLITDDDYSGHPNRKALLSD